MEFVFRNNNWELTFDEVAGIMNTPLGDVEWLLMKAMSLELVKGEINEVDKKVKITWLQPRVLDLDRIGVLAQTVGDWRNTVNSVLNYLENQAKELLD